MILQCDYCGAKAHKEDMYVIDRVRDRICRECLSLFCTDLEERKYNAILHQQQGLPLCVDANGEEEDETV